MTCTRGKCQEKDVVGRIFRRNDVPVLICVTLLTKPRQAGIPSVCLCGFSDRVSKYLCKIRDPTYLLVTGQSKNVTTFRPVSVRPRRKQVGFKWNFVEENKNVAKNKF